MDYVSYVAYITYEWAIKYYLETTCLFYALSNFLLAVERVVTEGIKRQASDSS